MGIRLAPGPWKCWGVRRGRHLRAAVRRTRGRSHTVRDTEGGQIEMRNIVRVGVGLVGLVATVGLAAGCGKAGSSGTTAPASAAAAGGCAPVAGTKLVVLEDDQHLQNTDNIIPAVNTKAATPDL